MRAPKSPTIRPRRWAAFVVALVVGATLLAANHCALGGMKPAPAAGHSCCEKSAPKTSPASRYAACCAPLAAPLPSPAEVPAAHLVELFAALPVAASDLLPSREAGAVDVGRGNAPPGPSVFVGCVLRRSLPALAPPGLVARVS